ncbi:MAG: ABC transporter ATP-binding protein [Acidobacteria bacterium]|nr:ABC transporter ATP-binding protein [Acidobacteriota bacterium]
MNDLNQIFSYPRQWKRALWLVWEASPGYTSGWALLLLFQGLHPVLLAYLTKLTIDSVVSAKNAGGDWSQITNALWFLGTIGVLLLAAEVFQNAAAWLRTAQAETFSDFLADRIHKKASEIDLAFYESPEYHDLLEQTRGDSSSKPLGLLESLGSIGQHSISIVGLCILLFAYAWWLPLVLILGALPALWITLHTDREYHRWWKSTADQRRWTAYYDAMVTHPNAAAEVRLFDLSSHFREKYRSLRARLRHQKLRRLQKQGYGKVLAASIALITAGGATAWMAVQVLYNLATLGDLGVFYQVFFKGQNSMSGLLLSVGKALNSSLYLENLFAFLDLKPNIVSGDDPRAPLRDLEKGISFKSVSFTYPGSAVPVIKDLDLFIPAGSVVALVGVNGAGKSTLIKLLNRLYDPTAGSIEFDGIDLRKFDARHLRRMMSVLSQFPMQFHALARENIALGDLDKEALEQEIIAAARGAGAHGFIMGLPEQYDTLLGKWFVKGAELSGGQWQRLALARAYFRRAPVVILDEPTSFMDPWSEVDWFDRFREMVAGKSGIVITHRLTIAMRADIIHVIDQGRIIESGTHRELLERNGFYSASWKAQMRTAEENQTPTAPLAVVSNGWFSQKTETVDTLV